MSKLVESLRGQMRSIFGESFGASDGLLPDIRETVRNELLEVKSKDNKAFGRKPPSKGGGGKGPPSKVKAKEAEKAKFVKKYKKNEKDRIRRNMSSFFKHADQEAEKASKRPRPAKLDRGSGGSAGRDVVSKSKGGGGHHLSGGGGNPFKHSPNLGLGPGTPPGFPKGHGKRHHDEKKCWNCSCGNIYTQGCRCVGTGATKDCPEGHEKKVKIDKAYRKAYNDMYHAWRRGPEGEHSHRKGKWQGPRR